MINLLISGALGRMGRKVYEATLDVENVNVVCGIDYKNSDELSFPVYDGYDKVSEKVDVIIDFSSPSALDGLLKYATNKGVNAVLCATGYTSEDIEKINDASKKIAIFRSANMSLGVNVLISLVKKATEQLNGFDVEIIEKHHNQKIDAPSGTALMLADAVKEVAEDKFYIYGREGICGKRNPQEIGIHAVRGGNIVGEHDVIFAGINETVTLSHVATDRSVFANGAVTAGVYLSDKKQGLYNMQDLVNGK